MYEEIIDRMVVTYKLLSPESPTSVMRTFYSSSIRNYHALAWVQANGINKLAVHPSSFSINASLSTTLDCVGLENYIEHLPALVPEFMTMHARYHDYDRKHPVLEGTPFDDDAVTEFAGWLSGYYYFDETPLV